MSNEIKFEQKYDEAFLGAEGWGEIAPFIAYTEKCVIIVDKSGISVSPKDESSLGWYNTGNYSYFSAKLVVMGLEKLNLEGFLYFVENNEEFESY
jgi:hypothetical protein